MSLSGMQLMALKPPGQVKNPGRGPDLGITYRKCSLKNRYLVAHPTSRKWVITPVINGISRVNPLIIGVVSHLLSGMSHQVKHHKPS
jgi:hypothetical protein